LSLIWTEDGDDEDDNYENYDDNCIALSL